MEITGSIDRLIDLAIEEDIGKGDITTRHLVAADTQGHGAIVAKQALIIAGLAVAQRVFERFDPTVDFNAAVKDGDAMTPGQAVVSLNGKLAALLSAERIALNFLQRLSGIATHVHTYVNAVMGQQVQLLDTRKTTPGWRALEKYAVRIGGGTNHRMGLYDAVLIKDNHIAASGGITQAVKHIKSRIDSAMTIEVETTNLTEVQEALDAGAHIIMLDNMDLDQIKSAVVLVNKRAKLEVSGGVTLPQLADLAATGVDLISSGALTHSAKAVDLSMKISAH